MKIRLYWLPIYVFEDEANYQVSLLSPTETGIRNISDSRKDWRILITVPQYEFSYTFTLDNNEQKVIELPLATNTDGAIIALKQFKAGPQKIVDQWTFDLGTDWIVDNPDNVTFENGYVTLKYWRVNNGE